MGVYKYENYLRQGHDEAFDQIHDPGIQAPYAGIFRCTGCGSEIGIAAAHRLPPQTHHTHAPSQGPIRWQLIVWADHNPK